MHTFICQITISQLRYECRQTNRNIYDCSTSCVCKWDAYIDTRYTQINNFNENVRTSESASNIQSSHIHVCVHISLYNGIFVARAHAHTKADSDRLVFTSWTIFTTKTYDIYTHIQIQQAFHERQISLYVSTANRIVFAYWLIERSIVLGERIRYWYAYINTWV